MKMTMMMTIERHSRPITLRLLLLLLLVVVFIDNHHVIGSSSSTATMNISDDRGRRMKSSSSSASEEQVFGSSDQHDDDDEDIMMIVPQVVTSQEGGWPTSLTGGPFYTGEIVTCCDLEEIQFTGGGVDLLSRYCNEECVVVSSTNAPTEDDEEVQQQQVVTVQCNTDHEERLEITLPIECCERHRVGDFPIYKSTKNNGLHYTGWLSMTSVFNGMVRLEKDYPMAKFSNDVVFLNYRDFTKQSLGMPCNVPIRIQNSKQYQTIYRSLDSPDSWSLESKREVAKRSIGNPKALAVFPVTYLSCEEALEGTSVANNNNNPNQLLFIKQDGRAWGEGIQIVSLSELQSMYETKHEVCQDDYNVVIQEAVEDLATIDDESRYDIRFYILIHDGHVYLHENASFKWPYQSKYNPHNSTSTLEFVQKFFPNKQDQLVSILTSHDRVITQPFMDAIYEGLKDALPVMEEVMNITKQDSTLYHIYGGDAMIRTSGKVVITEFNDWPNAEWYGGLITSLLEDRQSIGPIVSDDEDTAAAAYDEFVAEMHADFFAIVLGLIPEPTSETAGTSSFFCCEGRVREVVDDSGPETCNA